MLVLCLASTHRFGSFSCPGLARADLASLSRYNKYSDTGVNSVGEELECVAFYLSIKYLIILRLTPRIKMFFSMRQLSPKTPFLLSWVLILRRIGGF